MNEQSLPSARSENRAVAPREEAGYGRPVEQPWPEVLEAEDEGVPWHRYVSALFRYKWLVVLGLVLGLAGAVGVWRFVSPDYVAQGSLWVQSNDARGGDRGPIASEGLLQASAWVDLLRSYAVLDTVVRQEKLYLRPARPGDIELFDEFEVSERFAPGSYTLEVTELGERARLMRSDVQVDAGEPGDTLGEPVGFQLPVPSDLSPDRQVEFALVTPRDAARALRESLTAQMDRQGTFIRLELRGKAPERIARVLNGVMERHVELAAELKRGNLDERTRTLERQLEYVETELRNAERELEDFRVRTITLPSDDATPIQPGLEMTRDPVYSSFFEMKVELEQVRRDRERLEEVLQQQPDSGIRVEALELIPSVDDSPELQEALTELLNARTERRTLLERYTSDYPPVRELDQRIRTLERETVPSLIRPLLQQLRFEERTLENRIASAGGDLSEIPPRSIEEARLRRRVDIAQQLYTDLRSRYEEASLARSSSIPDVRILDRATVPEVPSNDQRLRMMLMVVLGGLGAGLVGALFLDQVDPRVRYLNDLDRELGLTILGAIPRIPEGNGKKGARKEAEAFEAFRDLRTSLTYAYGSAGPVLVTISSPAAGEGKSTVTANLGVAFAKLGKRTLVVDADTRRGNLHRSVGGERSPGLMEYLTGTAEGQEVLQSTEFENLYLIGSGARLSNSPELLSTNNMARMVAALKERFDVIIVDSPPLGAGSDAYVLSSLTGNLLLVLRSDRTKKDFAAAKLEPVSRLPVRIVGAVLNDYRPKGPGQYSYYSYGYGHYLPGYEAGRKDAEKKEQAPPRTVKDPAT